MIRLNCFLEIPQIKTLDYDIDNAYRFVSRNILIRIQQKKQPVVVLQQLTKRGCAYFDTASFVAIRGYSLSGIDISHAANQGCSALINLCAGIFSYSHKFSVAPASGTGKSVALLVIKCYCI